MRLIASTIVLLVASVFVGAQTPRQRADEVLNDPKATLHDAAVAAGGNYYTITIPAEGGWLDLSTIPQLVRNSELIIVGYVQTNACRLTRNKRSINVVYKIEVEAVLKGRSDLKQVEVPTPGGRFTFEDGTTAQIDVANYTRMLNGNRYLLFLSSDTDAQYHPAGMSAGVFELSADGTVQPYASSHHGALKRFKGAREFDFIELVRQEIANAETQ